MAVCAVLYVIQEPRVPTEWKMPVSSGTYAAEQVAKWNWYYRMVIFTQNTRLVSHFVDFRRLWLCSLCCSKFALLALSACYCLQEQIYYLWQQNVFPVKPNHVFCGFPIHLATSGEILSSHPEVLML